tara:strand:- start:2343 stop:2669 length:327 start_codon:yes stop_codon:yes gene_type:complete
MQIYNLLKTRDVSEYSLVDLYDSGREKISLLKIKEINNKLPLAEFKKDDGLFWASGRPDAFSNLIGATFILHDGRKYKVSWVKPIIDEIELMPTMFSFTAMLLVRRLS